MGSTFSTRVLLSVLGVVMSFAGGATGAAAQGYRSYDRWDGPRVVRPVPDDEDFEDQVPEEQADDRDDEPPRNVRRFDPRRYGDGIEARERAEAEWRYRNRFRDRNWGRERRFDRDHDDQIDLPRRYVRPPYRDDDDEYRDTAREPAPADATSVQGADGGGRPDIVPVAPPRVAFAGGYMPGSIVIDTSQRKLYYVTGPMSAFAYPIGVGREGFAWTGSEKVSRVADWPDWYPPAEMRKRKPELPEKMLGGVKNPLGAKAIYLGNTLYRIHGTNDPKSIGKAESSGCFRMLNQHVLHLASMVGVGTPVTVVQTLSKARYASKVRAAR
jgi:lipoprotein-anchoring transpeptidase ErfK/SrfK